MPGPLEGIRAIEISAIGIRLVESKPTGVQVGPAIGLKSQEGIEIALELIEQGHVLIEGFSESECFPKLVYGRMTG